MRLNLMIAVNHNCQLIVFCRLTDSFRIKLQEGSDLNSIILNGESYQIESEVTLETLLMKLSLAGKRIAVEVNQSIVPRSRYAEVVIQPEDNVEIVNAVGGG